MSKSSREKLPVSNLKSRWAKDGEDDKRKIMLTDLCPEEKAKVGELMLQMQKEKAANQQLTKTLEEERRRRERTEEDNQVLKKQITMMEIENEENRIMLATMHRELEERKKLMTELTQSSKQRKKDGQKTNCSVQTDSPAKANKQLQTITPDRLNRGVQTTPQRSMNQYSSSLHKSNSQMTPMATFPHDRTLEQQSIQQPRGIPPLPKPKILVYDELGEDRVEASELAKAWIDLKKWSIQKMKKDLEKKKKRAASQFSDESQDSEDVNNSETDIGKERRLLMAINHLNKPENTKSMGYIQTSQDRYKTSAMESIQKKQQTEIDEEVLNKLLKSTDFKASRLVKSTARTPNNEVSGKKMAKVDFYDAELLNLINDLND